MGDIINLSQKRNPMLICESATPTFAEKVVKYTSGKVKFSTILQTVGDINQNRRIYPIDVMKEAIQRIQPTIDARNFCGELDHPIPSGETNQQVRQTTILYKECSHLITKVWFKGNEILAEVETLSTPNGAILAGLILDKVQVGFSLRGLADLEDNGTHQTVLRPLIIIGWDCVQQPSHKKAVVSEIYQEDILMAVNESRQLLNTGCYLPDIMNNILLSNKKNIKEVIESKIGNLIKENWKPV